MMLFQKAAMAAQVTIAVLLLLGPCQAHHGGCWQWQLEESLARHGGIGRSGQRGNLRVAGGSCLPAHMAHWDDSLNRGGTGAIAPLLRKE